jgi:hypothetical protein
VIDLSAPDHVDSVTAAPSAARRIDPFAAVLAIGGLLVAIGRWPNVGAAVVGVAAFTVPGLFVVDAMRPSDGVQRATLVLSVSVVCWMLFAHVLLTLQWWQPRASTAIALLAAAAWRQRHQPITPSAIPAIGSALRHRRTVWAAAALLLWAVSLPAIDLDRIDDWGLISALPITFFAALAIAVVVGVSAALDGTSTGTRIAISLAPLLLTIYGTLAVLSPTLRYPWSYKHIGVIRLLDETGRLHPHVDLYNNFSGFFGLGALVRGATGVDPTSYGAWTQLVGEAMILVAIAALVHTATRSTKVARLTVVIYLITNWVGQNYFAPQTLGSLLSITVLALVWSWFMHGTTRRLPLLRRSLGTVASSAPSSTEPALLRRRRAVVALVFLGLLMTHPLTPVATIGAFVGLVCVGWLRDRALIALLGAVCLAWGLRVFTYFSDRSFSLGFGGSPTANAGGNLDYSDAPDTVVLVGQLTRLFSVGVWLLAVIGAVLCTWARRRIGLVLLAALVPFGIPLVQSYGGEAIYRVYLYSLPLMAALIAWGIVTLTPAAPRGRLPQPLVTASVLSLALTAGFLVAHFGREEINQVDSSEMGMEDYIAATVPDPAVIAQLAGSYPANATWRYPSLQVNDTYTPEVVSMLNPSPTLPPPAALDAVADDILALTDGAGYVVVSPGMIDSIHQLNELPLADTDEAVAFLTSNSRFRVVTRIDDTWLLEVLR